MARPAGQAATQASFATLSASYFAHMGVFGPYLPLWLQAQGLSLNHISLLVSLQALTRLLAPYGWGVLSDRSSQPVTLLRLTAFAALVCSVGLWLAPFGLGQWWGAAWLGVVLFLLFMNTSAMSPLNEAALVQWVSEEGRFDGKLYGQVRVWGSLGFLVAVLAAGRWFEGGGMAHLPHLTSAMLLVVLASTFALPNVHNAAQGPQPRPPVWPVLRQPLIAWFFASAFFHVLAHMGVYVFLSLYLDALGYSKTMIGLMWALGVVVEVGWFLTQGRWLPKLSLAAWLVLCALATVLRMGLTAGLGQYLLALLLAQALHAITFASHHSACIAILSQHFAGQLRGRGQALFTVIAYGVPGVVGGILGGTLSSEFGLASVFWASLAVSLVASACAWRVWLLSGKHSNF